MDTQLGYHMRILRGEGELRPHGLSSLDEELECRSSSQ